MRVAHQYSVITGPLRYHSHTRVGFDHAPEKNKTRTPSTNQTLNDLLEPSMCDWKWSTKVVVLVKPWVCLCVSVWWVSVCGLRASAPAPGRAETGVRLRGWAVCLWCSNEWLQGWSRTEDCSLPGWTSHHETARTSCAWTRDSSCREAETERQSHWVCMLLFHGMQCNGRNVSAGGDCAILFTQCYAERHVQVKQCCCVT